MMFFLAYFGGYPAIQFQTRHYFHLEFITWWAIGFVACQALAVGWSMRTGIPDPRRYARAVARGSALVLTGVVALAVVLTAGRWYQERQVRRLFSSYIAAPKVRLADPVAPLRDVAPGQWPQFLEVDVNEAACGPDASVTFNYDHTLATEDFTRTVAMRARTQPAGVTRIFQPVFERFASVEVAGGGTGCLAGVYRFPDLTSFPLLLGATLPPDWESMPLYQRLGT